MSAYLQCIEENCQKKISATTKVYVCPVCSGLLDVMYDFQIADPEKAKQAIQQVVDASEQINNLAAELAA